MTRDDRHRWDERWEAAGPAPAPAPSSWLVAHASRLPPGRILDIAAGRGRNARFLARRGRPVVAVDVSLTGLRLLRDAVQAVCMDLDAPGFRSGAFAGVVWINFLDRRLFPEVARWLRHGGVLLLDTFRIEQREIGHPRNPDHLLEPGELLRWLDGWTILAHREGETTEDGERAFREGVVAIRPG